MKELSVFIDESGDFGEYDDQAPYCIITMVFHEQSQPITNAVQKLEQALSYQYQHCLNISFNEEGMPGRSSAVFLHCLGPHKPWTGGCVAVPENNMKLIMLNVREDCVVVIDTMENLGGSF